MSGTQRNSEDIANLQAQIDAFKKISELPNRVTADGTEKIPVDVLGVEYQMLATEFFANRYQTKAVDFDVLNSHCDSYIKVSANNVTATIPDGVGWNLGCKLTLLIQGTGFTLSGGGSVVFKLPTALQDVENSIITIIKTDTDTYQVIQTGASSGGGGGGAVDSVNGQTGVVVLNADNIDDTNTTHKYATAAQLDKVDFLGITSALDLNQMREDIDANPQQELTDASSNFTLTNTDYKKTFFVNRTSNITVTIPETGLLDNFISFFNNIGTGQLIMQTAGAGATLNAPDGVILEEHGKGLLERKLSSSDYYLSGDWTV